MGDRKFEAGKVKFWCLWPFRMAFGLLASQPGEGGKSNHHESSRTHNNTGIIDHHTPDTLIPTPHQIEYTDSAQTIHTIGRDVSHRSFHGMVRVDM